MIYVHVFCTMYKEGIVDYTGNFEELISFPHYKSLYKTNWMHFNVDSFFTFNLNIDYTVKIY